MRHGRTPLHRPNGSRPCMRRVVVKHKTQADFPSPFFPWRVSFVRPRRRLSSVPTMDLIGRRAQRLSRSAVAPTSRHAPTLPGRALTASSTTADWMITGRRLSRVHNEVRWAGGLILIRVGLSRLRAEAAAPCIRPARVEPYPNPRSGAKAQADGIQSSRRRIAAIRDHGHTSSWIGGSLSVEPRL